ncbi:MFS transporter [Pseudalkalibacillus decolorationis]|uniref:MFS transporter n=1 Tax=Pseudalkalibacillus decolorationis TaxID=163879 RepID=UPI002147FE6C|nr:MFS transporter [Pseudalkalibacillus decolorationis]
MVQKYSEEVQSGVWKVLRWLLVFEFFLVFSNNIFNLISPQLVKEFEVSPSTISLVISLGFLAFGIFSIVFTILSDSVSIRKLILYSSIAVPLVALFGIVSDLSFALLISYRVLFGIAIAAPLALSIVIAIKYFDKLSAAKFFGYNTAIYQIASASGHLLGGYITEHLDWKWALMIPVVTIFSVPTIYKNLPEEEKSKKSSFDFIGAGLVTAFVTLLVMFLTFKMQHPILLILALVSLFILVVYSLKKDNPFIKPELFKLKGVALSLIVCALFYATQSAFYFIFPFILTDVYGMALTTIGVFYMITNIVAFITGMFSGRIIKAIGYRNMVLFGGSFIFIGLASVAFLSGYNVAFIFIGMGIFNIGYVLFFSGYLSNYTQLLPQGQHGVGIGTEKLVFQISLSIGTAFIAMFYSQPFMMTKIVDFSSNHQSAQFSNMTLLLMVMITLATFIFVKVFPKEYNRKSYDDTESLDEIAN